MEKVTVIGTGTMGHSIALAIAWADMPVTIYGLSDEEINQAKKGFQDKVDVLQEYELVNTSKAAHMINLVQYTKKLETAVKEATFVIEAAPENLALKQDLFQQMEQLTSEDTILASNSSSLTPTKISDKLNHPSRVINTHFWNPAHLIPLVEIIKGEKTADHFVDRAKNLLTHIHKQPIIVNKEVVGFVGNRLQFALFREAQYLLETGVATMEDIDTAVELSIGRRLGVTGPFMTADLGGLDVFKAISDYTFPDMSNHTEADATMNQLVEKGHLGEKSGKGYYTWDTATSKEIKQSREKELINWLKK